CSLNIKSEGRIFSIIATDCFSIRLFLPGETELNQLFPHKTMDQCTKQILHAGCQAIIVKKGKAGSSIYTNKKHVHLTGYPNDEVVDPVGPGDGFAAGFISGLIDSKSIEEAVDRGKLVGSMV